MRRLLSVLFALLASSATGGDEPVRFTHVIEFEGHRMPVPMELYATAESETRMDVKVAGNLRAVQRHLPSLLSEVVEDTCERRIGLQVDEAHAEGDSIRARGRVQLQLFSCSDPEDFHTRRRRLSNITAVDLLLHGRIVDECLEVYLQELHLEPSGFVGGVLNFTGLNRRLAERVRRDLNDMLNEEENCLDMPDALKLLNTRLVSGGLRDFGGGEMGFVLKGRVDVTAPKMVALLDYLNAEGRIGD